MTPPRSTGDRTAITDCVVLVEVHNTHGERRVYTLRPRRKGGAWVDSMDKDFYVSPFIDMDARYTVYVRSAGSVLWTALPDWFEYPAGEDRLSTWLAPDTYEWRVDAYNGGTFLSGSSSGNPPNFVISNRLGGVGNSSAPGIPSTTGR